MSMQVAQVQLTWTFGDRIRKVRRALGLEQREMAELLGTRQSSITNWETDLAKPRDREAIALRIQEITSGAVSAGWVLGLTEDPRGPVLGCQHPPESARSPRSTRAGRPQMLHL